MPKLLVIVTECIDQKSRGLLVMPKFTLQGGEPTSVRLKLPDGTERVARAKLDVAHIRGALPPFAMVRLFGETPESVPIGTEVWADE